MKKLLILIAYAAAVVIQQTAAQQIPSWKDLKYPPLKQVKVPEPAQFTLSNGMRVFLLEDHELPLISGTAFVRTGNLFDPSDKHGLSEVMAEVQRSGGTKTKTGDQLDEDLENMAASVECGMDETVATMSFSSLRENQDAVLRVFKDVMTSPEFRQDKIDLALSQFRSAIARRNDDPGSIPDRELLSILYGRDTPYGWQTEYADLAHIKRDDLIQFYRRYYFPKNIMLAVYGDFQAADMHAKLEKIFADWTVTQPDVPKFPPVTAKPAPGIWFAEKPDVTQTFFAMGELGGTFRDKDYAALQIAADILGQGFSSRLISQIRTKLGYVYDIGATWSANYDHPGTFRITGSTKSASSTETLQAVNAEIEKMRTAEVTEQELKEAKDGALNSFVFAFDSPAKTLNREMRYEYYGYPKDFLFEYQKAIAAVTRADVLRVSKEHFLPQNITIVAVGNPKEFGKPLTAMGTVKPLDLTIPEPKSETPSAPVDKASVERGGAVLERAQKAMGGADKLAAVKDVTQTVNLAMDPSQGGIKIKQVNQWIASGHMRQQQELPFGKILVYTDGKTGWLSTPQGLMPMPAQVLKQAQGEIFRELISLVLSINPSRKISAVDANTVEVTGADGTTARLTIDEKSGLPLSEKYRETGMSGAPSDVVETFSDWRDVGGIKLPFRVMIEQDGKKAADAVISDYKINTGLKVEDLSKKP